MVRSQQRQYISFWCGSLKTAQIKRRVRAEPDVTAKMTLGKRARRSVTHGQRKCAVPANGLGHFTDRKSVVEGKRASLRMDLGEREIIKITNKKPQNG